MEYGFKDASMRRIANAVGMSAAGLYKHFVSKEEMFSALVEPSYQGLLSLFGSEAGEQAKAVGTGDLRSFESVGDANLQITGNKV